MEGRNNCCELPLKNAEENGEEIQEVAANLAVA